MRTVYKCVHFKYLTGATKCKIFVLKCKSWAQHFFECFGFCIKDNLFRDVIKTKQWAAKCKWFWVIAKSFIRVKKIASYWTLKNVQQDAIKHNYETQPVLKSWKVQPFVLAGLIFVNAVQDLAPESSCACNNCLVCGQRVVHPATDDSWHCSQSA